ncbi:arylsulfatase [Pseudozobellia thermophila]|uniref:Arylsulfatase n=1 Tax=Pseudozobellia thermophila TaxID=192903 RepID=A0A1M6FQM4_9FLAO|nr:arylsulfatase [Pseudozobellia thermophila]SHI99976.1 arylsulfatase [Pseudozobellia thermophila]
MKISIKSTVSLLMAGTLFWSCRDGSNAQADQPTSPRPNIIYILADDLGYAEVGAYGQEKIETPNIDALASSGMLFTQHYSSAPVCAPARYMLLTGKHAGHAYIRSNSEWKERGDVWNYRAMAKDSTLEGQGPMPKSTVTLAHRLKDAGYVTGMVGKWGLGAPHTHSIPNTMGFDFFFGFNCQRQAHTYYPLHLYKNKERVHLSNDTIAPNTRLPEGADPNDPASYSNYTLTDYAPDLMFRELGNFISDNGQKPFFLYWATPIPHVALQAPKRWVDYYIEKFGEEEPYLGERGYFPHKNPHAAYAAMVSYLDENIGKLVRQLKDEGIYENTLIVFTSDNGPSYAGGADPSFFESAKPFEGSWGRGKGYLYEGGIRVPMIAAWPNKIPAGTKSDLVSAHYDMVATFAEVAGYPLPKDTDGISLLPTLLADGEQRQHGFMYWEFPSYGGQVALRIGNWKVLRRNLINDEPETLEVYDLENDPREQHNVAAQHPEIVQKAAEIFERERETPELAHFKIPAIENGLIPENKD